VLSERRNIVVIGLKLIAQDMLEHFEQRFA
jgi:hypothetical protein